MQYFLLSSTKIILDFTKKGLQYINTKNIDHILLYEFNAESEPYEIAKTFSLFPCAIELEKEEYDTLFSIKQKKNISNDQNFLKAKNFLIGIQSLPLPFKYLFS